MTIAPDLKLRRIGSKNMIARLSTASADLSEVFTLNDTAALLWRALEDLLDPSEARSGSSDDDSPSASQAQEHPRNPAPDQVVEALAGKLMEEFDIDPATAKADVQSQLNQWQEYGLIGR